MTIDAEERVRVVTETIRKREKATKSLVLIISIAGIAIILAGITHFIVDVNNRLNHIDIVTKEVAANSKPRRRSSHAIRDTRSSLADPYSSLVVLFRVRQGFSYRTYATAEDVWHPLVKPDIKRQQCVQSCPSHDYLNQLRGRKLNLLGRLGLLLVGGGPYCRSRCAWPLSYLPQFCAHALRSVGVMLGPGFRSGRITLSASCPRLSRASTSFLRRSRIKTWMAGTSPGHDSQVFGRDRNPV